MKNVFKLTTASIALALSAGAAQAANVHWSVGINLAPIGTVISNEPYQGYGPVYAPEPAYAPPVVYWPAPVYYPSPVYYAAPVQGYYSPPAVVVERPWGRPHHHWDHRGHDGRGYRDAGGYQDGRGYRDGGTYYGSQDHGHGQRDGRWSPR